MTLQSLVVDSSTGYAAAEMSRDVRKPDFCICENKDADQLRGNREADQRLCFRYLDSTIPLLPKYKNFKSLAIFCCCHSSVCVGPGRKPWRPVFWRRGSYNAGGMTNSVNSAPSIVNCLLKRARPKTFEYDTIYNLDCR